MDMDKDQFGAQRYSVLGQIWAHHNQSQLQWPIVMVGMVLVGLSTLLSSTAFIQVLCSASLWGSTPRNIAFGAPFLLAGVIVLSMTRTMKRAREIMAMVAREIDIYDETELLLPADRRFSFLNRPKGRVSGPFVLALIMILVAVLIGAVGLCLMLGWKCGSIPSILLLAVAARETVHAVKIYWRLPLPTGAKSNQAALQ